MVQVQHLRHANLCMRGARQWFGHHDLDWTQFLTKGLPVEDVEKIDDALARQVAQIARDDAAGEL